jgi:hypothetical protein
MADLIGVYKGYEVVLLMTSMSSRPHVSNVAESTLGKERRLYTPRTRSVKFHRE